VDRSVDRQSGEKSSNDARKVHELCQNTRHRHHPEQQYEVGVLLVLCAPQQVSADASETK